MQRLHPRSAPPCAKYFAATRLCRPKACKKPHNIYGRGAFSGQIFSDAAAEPPSLAVIYGDRTTTPLPILSFYASIRWQLFSDTGLLGASAIKFVPQCRDFSLSAHCRQLVRFAAGQA